MANTQKLSPQGYNINDNPINENPMWDIDATGGGNVPPGGLTGQVLAKKSATDYDTEWVDQSGGGGGVTPAQVQALIDQNLNPVKSNISDIETEQETQNTDISANTTAIGQLDTRVTNINGYAENIYNELNGRTTIVEASVDEFRGKIGDLENLTEGQGREIQGNTNDINAINQSLSGGTATQVLTKVSAENGDYAWRAVPSTGGVTLEQVHEITDPIASDVATNTAGIEMLGTTLRTTDQNVEALTTRVTTAETDIQTNAGDIQTNKTDIEALTPRVTQNETDIATNTGNISDLGSSVSSLESSVNGLEASFNPLNNAVNGAGTTGQVLTRTGTANNAFAWQNPAGGVEPKKIVAIALENVIISGYTGSTQTTYFTWNYTTSGERVTIQNGTNYGGNGSVVALEKDTGNFPSGITDSYCQAVVSFVVNFSDGSQSSGFTGTGVTLVAPVTIQARLQYCLLPLGSIALRIAQSSTGNLNIGLTKLDTL